jgi:lipoprotein-anchoring transpeptidase ErfK/SrfK
MNIEPLDPKFWNSRIMRVSGHPILSAGSAGVKVADQWSKRVGFWQMAVLTAAGTLGAAAQADAALFYWQDSDPGYYRPAPSAQPRRQRNTRKNSAAKSDAVQKETGAKPQGPLVIAISIDRQKVRVYDANGLFAESPVSTGMKGHSTPMGVFSIIQKHKFHHSNIYSGAPMPYMQRITWSGVAMHAGVLPGYPASHGCIRMPMAFAVKMWNWTKMGARVVVTPGDMTPASFSHPLLVAQKVTPQPVVADEPKNDLLKNDLLKNDLPKADMPAVKSDKGADAGSAIRSENSVTNLELRSTVGHASPLREQTRTADASSPMPANTAATMSDATGSRPSSSEAASAEAKPEAPKSESRPDAESTPANSADTASSDDKSAEASRADAISDQTGSVEKADAPTAADAAKAETASDSAKVQETAEDKPTDAKVEAAKPEVTKTTETKAADKPAEAIADAPAAPDAKKDTARLPGIDKAAAAKAEPKRTGQIAVFVSRKDSKLYVRQNFAPLFDVPVTIAPSDRPLGTHVFTAEADKNDPNLLRWSVVSLPVTARNAARNDDDDDRRARRRKMAGGAPAEARPLPAPDSPAEALDRITIPQDAMARITEALTTGSSIIVSDQGINQGETGEGTDFIVSLR